MATLGLLGLPWSGVTTVMRCLCGQSVAQDASQGVADVRDPRLGALAEVSESAKVVPATLEVVDLTRLVRGAKRGEGLGPELLAHMRTTDAVLLVVRCFQDDGVAHPSGKVDPLDDAETVELELVFADQAAVERRLERTSKLAKSGDKDLAVERDVLETLAAALEEGRPARSLDVDVPESLDLLTAKPALYIANVDESGNPEAVERLRAFGADRGIETTALDAKLEAEIAELEAGRSRGVPRGAGHRPAGDRAGRPGRLYGARPDPVLHHRAEGDAGVDDPPRPERAGGRWADPHRSGARIHPRRGDRVGQAGRRRLGGRGEAPRLDPRRGARLRRPGRRHAERPVQRVTFHAAATRANAAAPPRRCRRRR